MKWLLILVVTANIYAQDLKDRIEKLIIAPPKSPIVELKYDPFQKGQEAVNKTFEAKSVDKTLFITSILNNRVFANSSWHKAGDKVNGYKIIQIKEDSVLAKKDGKIVKFSIKRRDNIVKVEDK